MTEKEILELELYFARASFVHFPIGNFAQKVPERSIELEKDNYTTIHLHLVGVFWRAYGRSALGFCYTFMGSAA